MTWVHPGPESIIELRAPLAEQIRNLAHAAATAAPGRTAEIAKIRVRQLLHGASNQTSNQTSNDAPREMLPTDLTPGEQAALAVIEQFILDVHGIDNSTFAALSNFYTSAEQMALMFHLALLDGFTKLDLVTIDIAN